MGIRVVPRGRWQAAAIVACTLLVAVACGGVQQGGTQGATTVNASAYHPAQGTSGGKLVYSDWEQVTDLNAVITSAATTQQATDALWSRLWTFGQDNKPLPDMVTDVPTTANGMVKQIDSKHMDVTIKLRPGLKWSDGQPLTTQDVQFTWQATCDPNTGASNTVGYDHISSMTIKSDTEMVWHFGPNPKGTCGLTDDLASGLYAPYLLLTLQPMPKHILGSVPHTQWATTPYFTQKPTAVSGPYMVQSFVPGSSAQVVMVPNPDYASGRSGGGAFNHKPYLTQLIYKIYGDKASQINALKTGDTDVGFDMIANDLPAANSVTSDKTTISYPIQDEMVVFNTGNDTKGCAAQKWAQECGKPTPWKDDPIVRQALALATDKQTMIKQLVGNIGKVMNSPFPPNLQPWYDKSLTPFEMNVQKANQMLDSDGWTKNASGIREKSGRQLVFTLATTSGNPQRAAEEELLASNWSAVGAKVTFDNHPAGEFFGGFSENGTLSTGQYDAGMFTEIWGPDPDAWATFALISQIPSASNPAGANWGQWRDQKLSNLFLEAESQVDPAKRQQEYNQAQQEWESYAGAIELYQRPGVQVAAPYVGNFNPGAPAPGLDSWNIADWFHKGAS